MYYDYTIQCCNAFAVLYYMHVTSCDSSFDHLQFCYTDQWYDMHMHVHYMPICIYVYNVCHWPKMARVFVNLAKPAHPAGLELLSNSSKVPRLEAPWYLKSRPAGHSASDPSSSEVAASEPKASASLVAYSSSDSEEMPKNDGSQESVKCL